MSTELIVNGQGPVMYAERPDRDAWPYMATIHVGLRAVAIGWRKRDRDREAFSALARSYAENDENAFVLIHWDADAEPEWIKGKPDAFAATPYDEL